MIGQHDKNYFAEKGATATAREIAAQGESWQEIPALLERDAQAVREIGEVLNDSTASVLFSGAGTSAYVGEIVAPTVTPLVKARAYASASTDIVSDPAACVSKGAHGLLFAFARSGNSPESVDSVEKIAAVAPDVRPVGVTCNENGKLAKDDRVISLLMPPATHDESFVMTSSFSTMTLYTASLCRKATGQALPDFEVAAKESARICEDGYNTDVYDRMANAKRLVFLGSNAMFGAARESALKILEMTAGVIPTMAETSLGFRHGPKSLVNNETVIVVLVSNNSYTQQFDADIIRELAKDGQAARVVAIASAAFFERYPEFGEHDMVDCLAYGVALDSAPDDVLAVLGVQHVQLLGLRLSIGLDISPDNPCPSGEVNRVVQGVTLYPYGQ
ncbi:SIS domain-containing protein [Cardiobacteriaceae bacterium TAE3-ERU3]|nr:SIS domain-containing protein [Cardiobacteriaceae bacterium TAE3-ERU3]